MKHRVRLLSLHKNSLPAAELLDGVPILQLCKERFGSDGISSFASHKPDFRFETFQPYRQHTPDHLEMQIGPVAFLAEALAAEARPRSRSLSSYPCRDPRAVPARRAQEGGTTPWT